MTPGNRRVPRPAVDTTEAGVPAGPSKPGRFARVVAVLRTLVGVVLVIGTSVAVAWVVRRHITQSPRFAIAHVEIAGNQRRASAAIVAESGLEMGANVFVVDLDTARARILADPWISEATLARRLPGTIVVRVIERKAAALAALGDTFLTTAEGEPFKKLDADDPLEEVVDLPLVTGLRPEALTEDREGSMRTLRRAIDLAAEYDRNTLATRSPLQEVHVEPDGAFSLIVGRSAIQLVLGSPPFRRKLDQAARVVAELDKRGAKADAIMLDNDTRPDRVVVRMR
jgi:cell division protein FtsQ